MMTLQSPRFTIYDAQPKSLHTSSLRCLQLHPETLKESIATMSGAATAALRDEIRSAFEDVGLTKVDSAILSKCTLLFAVKSLLSDAVYVRQLAHSLTHQLVL
jgi:hypothetical protein